MAFTLEQLRGFVAVADELHFGRAAARLQMTQPPLSRQIQKLERHVGAQLLERDNRRVTLTAAGAGVPRRGPPAAGARRRGARAGPAGLVRVAAAWCGSGSPRVAPTAPSATCSTSSGAQLPDVDVDLHEMVTREQVAGACSTRRSTSAWPGRRSTTRPFDSRPLHREALLVALPAGHRLLGLGRSLDGCRPRRRAGDHALAGEGALLLRPRGQPGPGRRTRTSCTS